MKKTLLLVLTLLLQPFVYAQTPAVSFPLTVTDNAERENVKIILKFGLDPSATDGLDALLGESPLPPLPPRGAMDARFLLSDGEGSLEDYRQGSASFVGERTYTLQFQPGKGSAVILQWDLPKGVTGKIQDRITGKLINFPMSDSGSYTVADPESFSKVNLTINYTTEAPSSVRNIYSVPGDCTLLQNYPNPFNPSTLIRFTIKNPARVSLRVFNPLGQIVGELINEELNAGTYEKIWDAFNCPSGNYFYELRAGSSRSVKKMLLLR